MGRAEIEQALVAEQTIDIVTTGARSGKRRETEIWFTNVDGEIYICGTPSADGSNGAPRGRDWLANLSTNPDFEFCFKESFRLSVPARAEVVTDPDERRRVMSHPAAQWYRDRAGIERLVEHGPMVRVRFTGEFADLTA